MRYMSKFMDKSNVEGIMRQIKDNEIKEIELNILIKIDEVCRQNGWEYSLTAGTLIGAIRHKGFIPWDDDIDIMIPRNDYEKLIQYFENTSSKYKVITCNNNKYYQDVFAKVYDTTTIIEDQITDIKQTGMGVYVDVFPIDGLGDTYQEAVKNIKRGKLLQLIMTCAGMKKYAKSTTHSALYEPIRYALFCMTRCVDANKVARKLDKKNSRIDFNSSAFAGAPSGSFREKTIMKREEYSDIIDIEFENHLFKSIRVYDSYLRRFYGDYMKLPPKSAQVTHHTFCAYKISQEG